MDFKATFFYHELLTDGQIEIVEKTNVVLQFQAILYEYIMTKTNNHGG